METNDKNENNGQAEASAVPVPAGSGPRLSNDIIYMTIEKLFFAKARPDMVPWTGIDLSTDNARTRFMCVNSFHFNAMLAQFAKMERIEFSKEFGENKKPKVSFYRNYKGWTCINKEDDEQGVFSGPYLVTGHLVSSLIHYGKLRPSVASSNNFLTDKEPVKISLEGKKSLEVFSALFLGKVIEVPGDYDLRIKKLELFEEPKAIELNFEAILALNSEEIQFEPMGCAFLLSEAVEFSCKSESCKLSADRTKKISFNVPAMVTNKSKEEFASLTQYWTVLVPYLAKLCPNLVLLEHKVTANFGNTFEPNDFLASLEQVVEAVQGMFSKLADGSPQLKIRLELQAHLDVSDYESLPLDSHALFQLGAAVTLEFMDTPYTARVIKVEDKSGREHEFVFEVFQSTPDSGGSDYGLDYDAEDYFDTDGDDDFYAAAEYDDDVEVDEEF